MAAKDSDRLMNEIYKEAFGLVKYIFNVDEFYKVQIKLMKAFVSGKNIYFNPPVNGLWQVHHIKSIILL